MYAGAITAAIPTPNPPTKRQKEKSHRLKANAEPIAERENNTEAISITFTRPNLIAAIPAYHAPIAEPINTDATAKPNSPAVKPKPNSGLLIDSTVPLITAVSKPNKKPPNAAITEI